MVFKGISESIKGRVDIVICPIINKHLIQCGNLYQYTKILDMVETGFFALKKKNKQISFLHVYHHVLVFSLGYWAITESHGKILRLQTWSGCSFQANRLLL